MHSPFFALSSQKHHGLSAGQSAFDSHATRALALTHWPPDTEASEGARAQTVSFVLQLPPRAQISLAGIMVPPGRSQNVEHRLSETHVASVPSSVMPAQQRSLSVQSLDSSQNAAVPLSMHRRSLPFAMQLAPA